MVFDNFLLELTTEIKLTIVQYVLNFVWSNKFIPFMSTKRYSSENIFAGYNKN